jgi:hypothetical protein
VLDTNRTNKVRTGTRELYIYESLLYIFIVFSQESGNPPRRVLLFTSKFLCQLSVVKFQKRLPLCSFHFCTFFTMAATKAIRVVVASLFLLQACGFLQPIHPASRRSGLCMGAICPEIPLTPRPGHEIAIVACG